MTHFRRQIVLVVVLLLPNIIESVESAVTVATGTERKTLAMCVIVFLIP